MIPKVETCIYAIETGRRGRRHPRRQVPHAVLHRTVDRPRRGHADHTVKAFPPTDRNDETTPATVAPGSGAANSAYALAAKFAKSTSGCSISTIRSIRPTAISGRRSMHASRCSSPHLFGLDGMSARALAEILLPALRHDVARADERARRQRRRVSRLRPRHRPLVAAAQPSAGERPSPRCPAAS